MAEYKTKKSQFSVPNSQLSKKGFSLIEVLATLLILSIGIASVSFLMTSNIRNSKNSKNQIIASMLAQESIELVRNLRDNGMLNDNASGHYDYHSSATSANNLKIDMTLLFFNTNGDGRLYLNADNFYTHNVASAGTKFFRVLSMDVTGFYDSSDPSASTRVITATSFVTWNNEGFVGEIANPSTTNCTFGNQCLYVVSVMPDMLN